MDRNEVIRTVHTALVDGCSMYLNSDCIRGVLHRVLTEVHQYLSDEELAQVVEREIPNAEKHYHQLAQGIDHRAEFLGKSLANIGVRRHG